MPAIGTVNDEAPFFKRLQRLAETSIVDAKQSTQRGPGNGLRGTTQFVAYRYGKRKWWNLIAVDEEPERLAVA